MMRRTATLIGLMATVWLASLPSPARAQEGDPSLREWNQDSGNSERTGRIDVEPVRLEPRDAWVATLDGRLVNQPVTWGGMVYTLMERRRGLWLEARRISDGTPQGVLRIGGGTSGHLATWGGTVLVAEGNLLRGFRHTGGALSTSWSFKHLEFGEPLAVHRGRVFFDDGSNLVVIDATSGKALPGNFLRMTGPISVADMEGYALVAAMENSNDPDYEGTQAILHQYGEDFRQSLNGRNRVATFVEHHASDPSSTLHFMRHAFEGKGGWLVTSTRPFEGEEQPFAGLLVGTHPKSTPSYGHSIVTRPVVFENLAMGFNREGVLVLVGGDGGYAGTVAAADLPTGARPATGTGARDVAYFGNWALELASAKVLWLRKDLTTTHPAYPVADGRLLIVTKDGRLVCLENGGATSANPPAASTSNSAGGEAKPRSATPATVAPGPTPMDGPGLLTRDSRFLPGIVEKVAAGRWRVRPTADADVDGLEVHRIEDLSLLVTADGSVEPLGPELPVVSVFVASRNLRLGLALEALFKQAAGKSLLTLAHGILEEAREMGLPAERVAILQQSLSGKRPHPRPGNAAVPLETARLEARAVRLAEFRAAAEWCATRGLHRAATVLHHIAADGRWKDEAHRAEMVRCIEPLVPQAFPWRGSPRAVELWLQWAPFLVITDAAFVPLDAPFLQPYLQAPWNTGSIALRTDNLLFLSRSHDPSLVATCLDAGDRAVKSIIDLMDPSEVRAVHDEFDLLDVRLHVNQRDYLMEQVKDGFVMPWTAGYYSPSERISRFFVPRDDEGDVLGRGLRETMVHEITHHFLDVRWNASRRKKALPPDSPGFWVVEGFARYIEDQICSPTAGAHRMNDPTVPSLDTMAQAQDFGLRFNPSEMLDFTQIQFAKMDKTPKHAVKTRRTLQSLLLSDTNVFYEQAGATVFFLLHRAGPERREAFLRYLTSVYAANAPAPAWRALGWESSADFNRDFLAFLASNR